MVQMAMTVDFIRTIDGVPDGSVVMSLAGAELGALLATPANAGSALADEISLALYTHAVAASIITGAIT